MSVAGTFTMYGGNITGNNLESKGNEVFGAGVYLGSGKAETIAVSQISQ